MTETTARSDTTFLPYGRQTIDETDISAVVEVLKSGWLTQGPTIDRFEEAMAAAIGADYVVACSNGTAALHLALAALAIGPEDVVVTSPITFMASANCARYVGASVRFVDVDPTTGLMSPGALSDILRTDTDKKIKVVLPVHFAGQPVDLKAISSLAREHGAHVVDDASHAIGGGLKAGEKVCQIGGNQFADISTFSFHPVKHIAMGEGGAIATGNVELAERVRRLRTHGIRRDCPVYGDMAFAPDGQPNPWYHELQELGWNYRLSDIHAALGLSQLLRLTESVRRRNEIASVYDELIRERFDSSVVTPLVRRANVTNAFHLYVLSIDFDAFGVDRATVMNQLREKGIGTQVHYIPVHLQPYYRKCAATSPGDFPGAELYYARALSIPMYPALNESDCNRVVETLEKVLKRVTG